MLSFKQNRRIIFFAASLLSLLLALVYMRTLPEENVAPLQRLTEGTRLKTITAQEQVAQAIHKEVQANPSALRLQLARRLLGQAQPIQVLQQEEHQAFVQAHLPSHVKPAEILMGTFHGVSTYGVLEKSQQESNCLLIYHQGHAGSPYSFPYFEELKTNYYEHDK